jgi:hypothetical protein
MTVGPIEGTPGPEGTEGVSGPEGTVTPVDNGHPAWQPILDALPDETTRALVTPHLQEWDKGVQERFQSLHQQYEPWKPITEQADPDLVTKALGLITMMEQDPEGFYQQFGTAFGLVGGQGTQEQPQGTIPDPVEIEGAEFDPNDPVVKRLGEVEGVLGSINNFLQSQQQQQAEEAAIEEYNNYMTHLTTEDPRFKDGPYDEDVVDAMVANGISPEDALTRYQAAVKAAAQRQLQPGSGAPTVMGASSGGSGLPSTAKDPATLSSQDTRALVAEMARQAAEAARANGG